MEELRCRFLGVTVGDEVAAAASLAGGEGLAGGESNGSGGGGVSFFGNGLSVVIFGGGMDL